MKRAIFITARLGSSRLPRKHLLKINEKHCIEHVFENAKKSKEADGIVLCTTELEEDAVLCKLAKKYGVKCFRGSILDKLERWNGACKKYNVEFFVTVDADDLFCSPELIDMAFKQYMRKPPHVRTDFIEGEEEIISGAFTYGISAKALKEVCEIKGTTDTEMMWLYFIESGLFRTSLLERVPEKYKRKDIRMTLDYQEDYEFFKTVIEGLMREGKGNYSFDDILDFLKRNPEVSKINIARNFDWKTNQNKKINLVYKDGYIPTSEFGNLNNLSLNNNKEDEEFYYNYFLTKAEARKSFIKKVKNVFDLREKSFLSVACGVAGEESLLVGEVSELFLLDSSVNQLEFVKKIYKDVGLLEDKHTKVKFIKNTLQHYRPYQQFDIVYISGASDWMYNKESWFKIPEDYGIFLQDYLKEDGFALLRIYGPYAHDYKMESEGFMYEMFGSAEKYGFRDVIMFYNARLKTSLFVMAKKKIEIEIDNLDSDIVEI